MTRETTLITGSSKGLGRSIALHFSKRGMNVILHGRDAQALEEVKKSVLENNVICDVVVGEITSEDTIEQLHEMAERRDIGILINNAGMYINKPFEETTADEFRRIVEVNLLAPIMLTKKLFPLFQKKKSGLIVNINSIAGKTGSAGESAYAASKHGLRGFTKAFQFEANKDGVRVMDLYAGTMNTGMVSGRRDPEKCMQTEEVADLIYRLCKEYQGMRINEIDLSRRNY